MRELLKKADGLPMSVELYVFLESATLPDRDAWQHAINRAGHDLILDQHLQPRKNSGFVPVSYRGGATGFELDTGPSSDLVADMPPEAADFIGSGRAICVSFRVGADACDMADRGSRPRQRMLCRLHAEYARRAFRRRVFAPR